MTLILNVLALRDDGYHEVRLVLAAVSLYDTLDFAPRQAGGVRLTVEGAGPLGAPEDNLVYRAAMAFQAETGRPLHLAMHLAKQVPAGAGLGGGSANAAGTLLSLNAWQGQPLAPGRLRALALGLGSDVPFFLEPRPSLAEGRGERLTPLAGFPALELLIVKPPFAISTAEAYALAEPRPRTPMPGALTTPEAVSAALCNDFEAVLFPRHPALGEIKAALLAAGADGAVLSGTGSALVGVFRDASARDAAASALDGGRGWWVRPCRVLAQHAHEPEP